MLISSACLLRISVSKPCLKFKLKYPKTVIRTFYDLDKLKKILRMKISSLFFHHFNQNLSRILNQCLTPFETYDTFLKPHHNYRLRFKVLFTCYSRVCARVNWSTSVQWHSQSSSSSYSTSLWHMHVHPE